jgi:hypothetical protein
MIFQKKEKRIGVFVQLVLSPFYCLFFLYGLINHSDFNTFTIIIFFVIEIMFFVQMFVSFTYSKFSIEKKILKKITKYELKNINMVKKTNIGFYDFYIANLNKRKVSINFIFQKKSLIELLDYIKKENPECVFS